MAAIEILGSFWGWEDKREEKFKACELGVFHPHANVDATTYADVEIVFYNSSEKDIKYITFTYSPYNAVGDVATDKREIGTVSQKVTGPFEKGVLVKARFNKVWHDITVSKVGIEEILVEFMDGTSEHLSKAEIVNAINKITVKTPDSTDEKLEDLGSSTAHFFVKCFFPLLSGDKTDFIDTHQFVEYWERMNNPSGLYPREFDFEFNPESVFGQHYGEDVKNVKEINLELKEMEENKRKEQLAKEDTPIRRIINAIKDNGVKIGCSVAIAAVVIPIIIFIVLVVKASMG